MDGRHARFVLGVGDDAGPTEIRRAFRARAHVAHPDHGGDNHSFAELVDALASIRPAALAPRDAVALTTSGRRFDAFDSPRRPAPRREFADILQAATARLA